MKSSRILFSILFILLGLIPGLLAQPVTSPVNPLLLSISSTGGSNGCAVAYHPGKDIYYTIFAGNANFPLEVFSSSGEPLNNTDAGFDARGLWYNKKTGNLEGNGFGDHGIFSIGLDSRGFPSEAPQQLYDRSNQPESQSVNCFDTKKKTLIGLSGKNVNIYKLKDGQLKKTISLETGATDLNSTTVIFTGKKGYEYGLLDYMNNHILLFNKKGKQTATVQLPLDQYCEERFNFSYANNRVWIFDTMVREWAGYKIF